MPVTLNAIIASGNEGIVNEQGTIVNYALPVWAAGPGGDPSSGNGSLWPALLSGAQPNAALQLQIQIGQDWAGGAFSVVGVLNGASIFQTGQCDGSPGAFTLSVDAALQTPTFATLVGDVVWSILPQQGGAPVALATTRLELIYIYGPMPNFFGNLNYVWVLRTLLAAAGQGNSAVVVAGRIADRCFTGFNKFYDTIAGRAFFGCTPTGGIFQLNRYWRLIAEQGWSVNCYDQAGCVQTMLGAVGLSSTWLYMAPFGYITTTNLIGWPGGCNNPFFRSNNTAQVVNLNDPLRTGFGNHAFIMFGTQIMDACAGPHIGAEDETEYVDAAIDTQTILTGCAPGDVGNIDNEDGLGSLTMGSAMTASPDFSASAAILLGKEAQVRESLSGGGARPDWTKLARSLARRHRLVAVDRDLFPYLDGVLADWRWRKGEAGVQLRVFRAKDPQAALSRLLEHLGTFQNDPARCLERDPAFGPAGLRGRGGHLILFVRSDFFVTVSAPPPMAEAMARQVDEAIRGARSGQRPFGLSQEERSLNVGERIGIACRPDEAVHLDGRAALIAGRGKASLDVAGRQPGRGELRLGQVEGTRLDLDARTIRLDVSA
jgi:hypothetical protein